MTDFKKQGGVLTGREERYDGFEGEPRSVGGALSGGSGATGTTGSGVESSTSGSGRDTFSNDPTRGSTGSSATATTSHPHGESNEGTTGTKPSMMDKMNPKTDADNDGKSGFMK